MGTEKEYCTTHGVNGMRLCALEKDMNGLKEDLMKIHNDLGIIKGLVKTIRTVFIVVVVLVTAHQLGLEKALEIIKKLIGL